MLRRSIQFTSLVALSFAVIPPLSLVTPSQCSLRTPPTHSTTLRKEKGMGVWDEGGRGGRGRGRVIGREAFYSEYYGHRVPHLELVVERRREKERERGREARFVYLVGDSSMDNKYWLGGWRKAVNGYEDVLEPPTSRPDVAYWLNKLEEEEYSPSLSSSPLSPYMTINAAVEESTVGGREELEEGLLEQDLFVRRSLTPSDVVIASVGGNDLALRLSPLTLFHSFLYVSSFSSSPLTYPLRLLSPWSENHLSSILGDGVERYVERLVGEEGGRPKKVLVCMIYYPCLEEGGWAGKLLGKLGYYQNPRLIQSAIERLYEKATCNIKIKGTEVVPVPLFQVLDPSKGEQYVAGVEPSEEGGRLMAKAFLDIIHADDLESLGRV